VQNIGNNLYVAYARQNQAKNFVVIGAGLGFVDVFSSRGRLLMRLEHGDWFNAPFGLVLAPTDFGSFSHKLVVGQFGSGEILAFDAITGHFEGKLRDQNDNVIVLRGYGAFRLALDRKAPLSEADVIRLAEMSAPQLHLLFHWLVYRLSLAEALERVARARRCRHRR
jgi:uncharacterized protein (TIGR03118 family)